MSQSTASSNHGAARSQDDNSSSTLSPQTPAPPRNTRSSGSEDNLNEVAARARSATRPRNNSGSHIQEAKTDPTQADNVELQASGAHLGATSDKSTGDRLSKIVRTTCIVGYLVLFSFVGTLLRIAIECLTFYPGTPVNTSVLWANVGGSFIMGFLSEDQEIFRFEEIEAKIPEEETRLRPEGGTSEGT
ncbi:hypothetical protein N7450_011700 [Penicillium hetheringtonii]|uniref:Uncharacterized protein n=1 Tax=Penicillium hetheringtonii TaxID=911720 RepID=A0AAD6DAE2_9EURO|nr:hypothetical protein N7450_011700 [Penicillium hetheringtonii]